MRDEDRSDPRPDDVDDELEAAVRGDERTGPPSGPSLFDDVAALVSDSRNFVQAEVEFQKTRLAFAANRSKSAVLSGLFALAFIHLALIALVVGLVIALTPHVTAWGATAIVVGLLLLGAFILVMRMQTSTREIGEAFNNANEDADE
ncbi:MAG: hypothetical protein APF78_11785 [Sphingomonadales bacterium BRH_c3]|nr:MAG: hypothetical protein APF78_11785 [Sphingomonadales bacterium BRH_c3]